MSFYLITKVIMFSLSLRIYEIFANQIVPKVDLENEGHCQRGKERISIIQLEMFDSIFFQILYFLNCPATYVYSKDNAHTYTNTHSERNWCQL